MDNMSDVHRSVGQMNGDHGDLSCHGDVDVGHFIF